MDKIPTIFVRDFANQGKITHLWHPDCIWVKDGFGVPTVKWDGTSCKWEDGKLWKRNKGEGWLPVGDEPNDQWHREALGRFPTDSPAGTYELVGPKINGNKHGFAYHWLIKHGDAAHFDLAVRTWDAIHEFLLATLTEGIVWHHPDGRMAKIKRRDFGIAW